MSNHRALSRTVVAMICLMLVYASARADCPPGYPHVIFCDDFDTYCTAGGGYPGDPACDPETASKSDGLLRQVWRRISTNECNGNIIGTEFTGEDLENNIWSQPFGARFPGQTGTVLGLQSFRDWTEDGNVYNMSRLIKNTFGTQYDAVAGTDQSPLVMEFLLGCGPSEKIIWSSGYMELALDGGRANTDYVVPECTCEPVPQNPLMIMCAQGNPESALPTGCPPASTAPQRNAIAVGALSMLDPTPCHCTVAEGNAGINRDLVVFDGKLWWTLRLNDPLPSTGFVTPVGDAPMPPPPDINAPGSFTLSAGGAWLEEVRNARALNWVTLTIRASTFRIELKTLEMSSEAIPGSDPPQYPEYYVHSIMDNIPRRYLGPFNTVHSGVGEACPLASSGDWDTCAPNPTIPCRRAIKVGATKAYYVDFDDFVLHEGAGYALEGACCLSSGACVDGVSEAACALQGGVFRGSSTTCDSSICLGACCQPMAACTETLITGCGGDFLGIGTGCTTTECPCHVPFADADWDGDVDQADFSLMQACFTGPGPLADPLSAGCACFDHDLTGADDGDVDADDFEAFEECASGPGIPADPGC